MKFICKTKYNRVYSSTPMRKKYLLKYMQNNAKTQWKYSFSYISNFYHQGHPLVDELHPKKYFAIPPSSLSPIPQGISPSPNGGRSPVSPYANSPNISPRTTPRTSPHHSKPSSPRRSPSPAAMAPASGSVSPWGATTPRPFSPQKTGNLARLASRRKSVAQNRRTSNYLELPGESQY